MMWYSLKLTHINDSLDLILIKMIKKSKKIIDEKIGFPSN